MIESIRSRLAAYEPDTLVEEGRARAAVLVPLYMRDGEWHVVLTKRAENLGRHQGEVSFPGGSFDPWDTDLWTTALRESHEEIGLIPDIVEPVGRLNELITVSHFHVTPFVGEIDPVACPYVWCREEREVAEILEVPLAHLMDPANLGEAPVLRQGEMVLRPAYSYGGHLIWGATQRILQNFLDVACSGLAIGAMAATTK